MASGLKLKDMARGKKELTGSKIGEYKPSPYSYEHRVTLDDASLTKLGVNTPKVGDVFDVMAHGHVTSVSQDEGENGKKSRRVELQLKKMAAQKQGKKGKSALDALNEGIENAKGED
jgi:hypothetical protein